MADRTPDLPEHRWWNKPKTSDDPSRPEPNPELAAAVFAQVDQIDQSLGSARRKRNNIMVGLYENREPNDGDGPESSSTTYDVGDITLNVSASCVDTLEGKIAPIKPRPMFVTVDGSLEEQLQAKGLQRFVMGSFLGGGAYREGQRAGKDAKICDIGVVKLVPQEGHVGYERVHPNELLVDEDGALDGRPTELFQRKWIPTDILAAEYPMQEEFIRAKANTGKNSLLAFAETAEGWKLPDKGKKNGRHVIVCRGATLLDEPWKDDSFPFAFLKWKDRSHGFYGLGLVEELHGIQVEITTLVQKIKDAHALLGIPWVVTNGPTSNVKQGAITNQLGEIINGAGGGGVDVRVHQVIAPEVYSHLENLFSKAYELSGISQLSAMSKKPAGVESGVALRTLLDAETTRFGMWVESWQNFFLDLARETVKMARRMGTATAFYKERDWAWKVDFSEVDLDDERYHLQLWPTNLLPETPTGKLATVEQMITIGLINPDQGMSLLDFPDLEAFQRWNLAAKDNAEAIIENILRKGESGFVHPTKYMNLGLSIQMMQGALLRGQIQDWPDDRLMLLERWCDLAAALMAPPMPAPPPPGAGAPPPDAGPPTGMPPGGPPSEGPMPPPDAGPPMQPTGSMPV